MNFPQPISQLTETQRQLVANCTDKGRKYALMKRGSIINEKWFTLPSEGRDVLVAIYNKMSLAPGDVLTNDGLVKLDRPYLAAFAGTEERALEGLRQVIRAGYLQYLDGNVFRIIPVWETQSSQVGNEFSDLRL